VKRYMNSQSSLKPEGITVITTLEASRNPCKLSGLHTYQCD